MNINLLIPTLLLGMITCATAQPSSPDVTATPIRLAETNWSNGQVSNNIATTGNGGWIQAPYTNRYPYATDTNPYVRYTNPISHYTNPAYTYAQTNVAYTNPNYVFARTNAAYVNPRWSNASGNLHAINYPDMADSRLTNTNSVHHWWNW